MFEDLKKIPGQKLRSDTLARLVVGMTLFFLLILFSFERLPRFYFLVGYFWTQAWSYGDHYMQRSFRPALMRIIMELFWPFYQRAKSSRANSFVFLVFCYLPPLLILCALIFFLKIDFSLQAYFLSFFGICLGGVINVFLGIRVDLEQEKFPSEESQYSQDGFQTQQDLASEEDLSETSNLDQSHQRDSE